MDRLSHTCWRNLTGHTPVTINRYWWMQCISDSGETGQVLIQKFKSFLNSPKQKRQTQVWLVACSGAVSTFSVSYSESSCGPSGSAAHWGHPGNVCRSSQALLYSLCGKRKGTGERSRKDSCLFYPIPSPKSNLPSSCLLNKRPAFPQEQVFTSCLILEAWTHKTALGDGKCVPWFLCLSWWLK